ncbi:Enolase 4 [Trichoplax sp. H2]|nr:Enolase 4 [Trichoplax sp. H2]|eukprot:RDD42360.1 Enolase 4 [Trichoplax sp. H2]
MASTTLLRDYERKQNAVHYFKENDVPKRLEELLNKILEDEPEDIFGYMAEHFSQLAKLAVINNIKAEEVYDNKGNLTVQVSICCKINGIEKVIASSCVYVSGGSSNHERRHHNGKKSSTKTSSHNNHQIIECKRDIQRELAFINTIVAESLLEKNPINQPEIDQILREVKCVATTKDEEQIAAAATTAAETAVTMEDASAPGRSQSERKRSANKMGPGGHSTMDRYQSSDKLLHSPTMAVIDYNNHIFATSIAIAQSAGIASRQPTYAHIDQLMHGKARENYVMPIPLSIVLTRVKSGGKIKFIKDVMIFPSIDIPYVDGLRNVVEVYQQLGRLSIKTPLNKHITDMGSYAPVMDKFEQIHDMLRDACTHAHLEFGKDIFMGIKCASEEIYDTEKSRYEKQQNIFKSSKEMIDMYADLLEKYPAFMMIIDALHPDDDNWAEVHSRLSHRCYIVGDRLYSHDIDINEKLMKKSITTAAIVRLSKSMLVSDVIQAANVYTSQDQHLVISNSYAPEDCNFVVDLAVGVGARFLQLGGPGRSEWTCKYNRLADIWSNLHNNNKLSPIPMHTVPREVQDEQDQLLESNQAIVSANDANLQEKE